MEQKFEKSPICLSMFGICPEGSTIFPRYIDCVDRDIKVNNQNITVNVHYMGDSFLTNALKNKNALLVFASLNENPSHKGKPYFWIEGNCTNLRKASESTNIPIIFVAVIDTTKERKISYEEARLYIEKLGGFDAYYECNKGEYNYYEYNEDELENADKILLLEGVSELALFNNNFWEKSGLEYKPSDNLAKALLKTACHYSKLKQLIDKSKESNKKRINNVGEIKISIALSYQKLTFGKELGRGGFGIVYEGQYQFGQVAIKTLLHQDLKDSLVEEFKKEASIMASLRSPFIVSLYGVCLEKPHYALVMEYMPNGSLDHFLQNGKSIAWKIRYQIGLDVGGGLAYLHNHEMVHCDLKSLNILLDINHRAKISDFGLSKVKLETSFSTIAGGSTRWMAPELFDEGAKSTKAADVFAYGVVLWELGARKFPFATTRNEAVPMLVCRGKREEITKDTPSSMAKLIAKCWDGRAEVRPQIDEAVKTLQAEQASYKF
jgi:hypothetical protein